MTEKIDFKKTLPTYRARRGRLDAIEIPVTTYLMIDGHGDPNTSPDFADALAALYPVAYKTKFASKVDLGRDYVVPPLEGLWWAEDMESFTNARDKSLWDWTLMIMVPDWIDRSMFSAATEAVIAKDPPKRIAEVRLETLSEGRCVQTLHVGPFDDEARTLELMHDFIRDSEWRLSGKHHEIYLSDLRRVAPDKQRTILRQPVVAP